ncbi:MAG: hypothetical protein HN952_06130 [Candidatus Cloacimonetes bacterium]|jgi:hypothetical protein|nr:hypothetical protein [Candidatus Cloacimonadota bacterium]
MKKIVLIAMIVLMSISLFAKSNEKYFKFEINSKAELNKITRIISIANVQNKTVFAYANEKELREFSKLGYAVEFLQKWGEQPLPKMALIADEMRDWDSYPTYQVYVDMMYQFATDYPNLCTVTSIGQSEEGREILVAKISDNVNDEENEPEFFYTGTMHGDELVGYPLMLRLIDYLLTNYGSNDDITELVNNVEIYINPNSNPDGTYAGGNNSVWNATRYNSNSVDLNRNYPDPDDGAHPDGNSYQAETTAMMDFAEAHSFVLSSNLHSGAEVVNYPWDTYSQLTADDGWWQDVCHGYANTVQANSPNGYMNGFNDGITNGYAWYSISGGRQDYMNYYHGCREMTLELSNDKLLAENELNAHWDYNCDAFINYIKESLNGIRGIVTNESGTPLFATITVLNHDVDNAMVYTDPDVGDFHRMLETGVYDIEVSAYGCISQTIDNINVADGNVTVVDVVLNFAENVNISGVVTDSETNLPIQNATIEILDLPINPVTTNVNGEYLINNVLEGNYTMRVFATNYGSVSQTVSISDANTVFNFQLSQAAIEDFESGNFSMYEWEFNDAMWLISNVEAFEGIYSATSGTISDGQSSGLQLTLDVFSNGEISFFVKMSSEADYDFLKFYIDDSEQGSWSGSSNWTEVSFPVSTGTHTFEWVYEKDSSVSNGSDCGWIDYIVFPAIGTQEPANLEFTPESFAVTLAENEVTTETLSLSNSGEGTIDYSINLVEITYLRETTRFASSPVLRSAEVAIVCDGGDWQSEISWNIVDEFSNPIINGVAPFNQTIILENGIYTLNAIDSYGDGWNGNYLTITGTDGTEYLNYTLDNGSSGAATFEINAPNPISWLSLSQNSGFLGGGQTDNISVYFDSSELILGSTYLANIVITNSAGNDVIVPITLNIENEEPIMYGDVDGNGQVQAMDASLTLQNVVDMIDFAEWQIIAADVDGNGQIQAMDASYILQYVVGIIDDFPIEDGRINKKNKNKIRRNK